MRKQIILQFSIMFAVLAIAITGFSSYNLRNSGIESAINKAKAISEVVKNGLTAHMINGNMDQRKTFLQSISNMDTVDRLWIVRSKAVEEQFGAASEIETVRDEIDEAVLKTGKMEYHLNEGFSKTSLRITLPYNATNDDKINCLNCHNVKYGETLGVVSLKLDITDLKQLGLESIYIIVIITIISIIFIIFISSNILKPYLELFESLGNSIEKAVSGNFVTIRKPLGISSDLINLTDKFNSLLKNFKDTFTDIDRKLKGFVGRTQSANVQNPLDESKDIIENLSNLYQFKKEIELDNSKNEIFHRLTEVFTNNFKLKNFTIFEINHLKGKRTIVVQEGDLNFCNSNTFEEIDLCRTCRTKNDVVSTNFHSTCQNFTTNDFFYFCINIDISKNISLIINFVFETQEELEDLKENIQFVKSYIYEAAPSLEVKLLLDALKESAFRDGLTGLHNRKFLEEYIKKGIPQAIRENKKVGLLMLDMDHFKAVNDEYGHDIGDLVLKELARILTENVRESDIVIRFGGEEFMVLLMNIDSEESALGVANKIREKVSENEIDVYAGTKLRKTISIGLSMFPQDTRNFDVLCKNADIALYEAKNKGRNQVVRFAQEQVSSIDLF